MLGEVQGSCEPRLCHPCEWLRHTDINAQFVRIGDAKQFRPGALPGIDQRTDVGIAGGNDAGERGNHPLERLQLAQPRHVGRGRLGGGGLRSRIAGLFVRVLLGYGLGCKQGLPSRIGALGKVLVCAGRRQIGLCLGQLLIDFRGLDLREQLSLDDRRADVRIPDLEVAIGSCVDRRLNECLYGARQHQFLAACARFGGGGRHGRYGSRGILFDEFGAGDHPADLAPNAERNGDYQADPREAADSLVRHGQTPRVQAAASCARE